MDSLNRLIPYHFIFAGLSKSTDEQIASEQECLDKKFLCHWMFKKNSEDGIVCSTDCDDKSIGASIAKKTMSVSTFSLGESLMLGSGLLHVHRPHESENNLVFYVENALSKAQTNAVVSILIPHFFAAFMKIFAHHRLHSSTCILTKRETEVLEWIKEGKSTSETGIILSITERTVKFHLSNIYKKLDTLNRPQAISKAIKLGLITP
ncbi:MAG: helix-turn-helix transcriptional regulator [Candidatus Thiodiazotropha sp. (ex Dulcina madagascariensis)]|nr:helix-turn-helix transcriptional regulator [Candidatus Thiodiazotropha sp. (ex Dulcina madagascariensis)]